MRLRHHRVAAENLGRYWSGIDVSPKAVELVNMRLQQPMGDLFHNRLVQPAPTSPSAPTLTRRCRTARTSTSSLASRRADAKGAVASSRSAYLRWTTSSRAAAVRTTSRTCNCYAPTATGSRVTDRRSTSG